MSQVHVPADGAGTAIRRGNRRATVRYRCAPATVGKVFLNEDHEFQRACILDLSTSGVGLLIPRRLETGQYLVISVRSTDRSKLYELYAQVAHSDPLPMGEWIIGCELAVPLTPDDLDQLL